MTDQSDTSLLKSYIEKIGAVHSSITDLHAELGQLRRDARADGFNMEAIQILSQIVAKSSHDGGQGELRDIVKYAHQIGINLETVTVETEEIKVGHGAPIKSETVSMPRFSAVEPRVNQRLTLLFQLGLGLGVAWMFIALLN